MNRFSRVSGVLAYVTLLFASVLIVSALSFLALPDVSREILVDATPGLTSGSEISPRVLYGVHAAAWLVLGVNLFMLWHVYSLFCLYSQNETLSNRCGLHVRRIGLGLVLLPFAVTVYRAASSVLLSWHNAPGERELVLAIDVQTLGFAIGGVLLMLVGATIREATVIADENRSFV